MGQLDTLEVVNDALECKVPKRVPTFCLGADWDFMERFIAEVGFTYEELRELKRDKVSFFCPTNVALSVKLGVDLTWTTALASFVWLDDVNEVAEHHGGRMKFVIRDSTYEPPKGREKRPIPHFWFLKEGLTSKESIQEYMKKKVRYSKGLFRSTKKMVEVCEKKYNLIVGTGMPGPWENLHFGIGYANIAKFWRKERGFLHDLNKKYIDFSIKGMENMMKIVKPRVVMIGDDYGFNTGLQMSLEMWRELVKPTLVEYVKIIHDAGGKCLLHSCGKIEELFNDFAEIGLDGVESLQPQLNDLNGLKRKFGDKIAFLGTIDDSNMLKYSSPKEVKNSVTQSIRDLGPGGYIPGATNFLLDQPVKSIYAMFEAIREYKI